MTLDERLLRVLACPIDKGALLYFAADELLYNPRIRRLYHVESGIPLMRADQAQPVDEDRHLQLLSRARAEALVSLDVPITQFGWAE
ncbi:Trm112 family protein [Amycolatopsis sp. NPDC003865]